MKPITTRTHIAARRSATSGLAALSALLMLAAPALAQDPEPEPSSGPVSEPAAGRDDGPAIELAPEHEAADERGDGDDDRAAISLGAGTAPNHELVRGMTEQRFRSAQASTSATSIGGYGEVHFRGTTTGEEGEREWLADVPRLVLFVAHQFDEAFRFYTEIEVEHAIACKSCVGAIELEQAYVDWKLLDDWMGLRAGLVILPMGIINQWHEPPVFHGVVRPRVETVVIPSTWRELGVGAFGQPTEWLRYEIYAMTGLDPLGFGPGGIGGGRQNGGFAAANAWAAVGRVEVEPLLGVVVGAAGYASDAGPNGELFDAAGEEVDLSLPLFGWAVDARWRRKGLEWKVLYAEWRLPESEALMAAYDETGAPIGDPIGPIPTVIRGGYIEAAYDVLRPFGVSHQLLPFARIEAYDTQAEVPDSGVANPTFDIREYTFGLSYRPIQQVVVKADYQLRNRKLGFDQTQLNLGVGFMY